MSGWAKYTPNISCPYCILYCTDTKLVLIFFHLCSSDCDIFRNMLVFCLTQCFFDMQVWYIFFSSCILFLSHLKNKNSADMSLTSLQDGQSREIISFSISYSWTLSHTPEIVLWSSLLCPHREEPSVKWHPTSSHREQQIRVAAHREGVIVIACLRRPFSKLVLINKLIRATLQLA